MKKDEARYTVRFNPADPRHQVVMAALDAAGRKKASFLADAAYYYLTQFGADKDAAAFPHTSPYFYTMPENVSQHQPNISTVAHPPTSIAEPHTDESDSSPPEASEDVAYDEDMRKAVLGGLSAFRK